MSTFAESLVAQIREERGFWTDLETISALAIRQLIPGVVGRAVDPSMAQPINRLLQAASALSQTESDADKRLAQDLAFFCAIATEDIGHRSLSKDILYVLGNMPGADRLSFDLKLTSTSFSTYLRHSLLRTLNSVTVKNRVFSFTDFQHQIWTSLPASQISAISAPTSAGKSFVVIEYLCNEAAVSSNFTAVFVAPTRALIGEIHGKLTRRLAEMSEDVRVSTIPTLDKENRPKQIFVLTQERLQILLATFDGTFDLVVVDEAQSIGDDSRGMILQDCLETIATRDDQTRFLFLAPGASGFDAITQALGFSGLAVFQSQFSPVVQNRIVVEPMPGKANEISLSLITENRTISIGSLVAERGFEHSDSRLAAVALELGKGGSLVYGTGPADAEKVAAQIASALPAQDTQELRELSTFVETHVHPSFSLVKQVLKGVGVHYGKMPSLLREALEDAFKREQIKYLVCTTTLFQGVNLPARSVFIDTPTRGRKGVELDPAALWNFAGRAGRLGQDIVGNVFLVGYNSWETKPLNERARFAITPSFRKTIQERQPDVMLVLQGGGDRQSPTVRFVGTVKAGICSETCASSRGW